jgi:hypothetical protein
MYINEGFHGHAGDYLFINLTDVGHIVIRPVKARDIHPGYVAVDSPLCDTRTE